MEIFGFFVGALLCAGIIWVYVRVLWHLGSFLKVKAKNETRTRV